MHYYPVSPRLLGPVQRVIGLSKEAFSGVVEVMCDHRRHTRTQGDLVSIAVADPEADDRCEDRFGAAL